VCGENIPRNRLETFLACRIPYLTLQVLRCVGFVVLDGEDAGPKLDADGNIVRGLISVVGESKHQVRLAYSRVAFCQIKQHLYMLTDDYKLLLTEDNEGKGAYFDDVVP